MVSALVIKNVSCFLNGGFLEDLRTEIGLRLRKDLVRLLNLPLSTKAMACTTTTIALPRKGPLSMCLFGVHFVSVKYSEEL